ncbi:MAG: TetR family transcriptional regulator [Myxococcota bacterium]
MRQVMARPIDTEKRNDLASRAVAVLEQEGFELSMATLASRLEVKRPTLLYHFPTKAAIVEHALGETLFEQAQYVLSEMGKHPHPLDQLHAQIRAVHTFHHGREHRIVLLTQAVGSIGAERMKGVIEVGNQAFAAHRRVMRMKLEAAIAAGTMHPCDIDSLLALVRSCNDGLLLQRLMTGCELAPVHQFIWDHILAPLKIERAETNEAAGEGEAS